MLASYTTLNIFIAIVVNTMSEIEQKTSKEGVEKIEDIIQVDKEELRKDVLSLKEQIIRLEEKFSRK